MKLSQKYFHPKNKKIVLFFMHKYFTNNVFLDRCMTCLSSCFLIYFLSISLILQFKLFLQNRSFCDQAIWMSERCDKGTSMATKLLLILASISFLNFFITSYFPWNTTNHDVTFFYNRTINIKLNVVISTTKSCTIISC